MPDARVEEVKLWRYHPPYSQEWKLGPVPVDDASALVGVDEVTAFIPPKGVRLVGLTEEEIATTVEELDAAVNDRIDSGDNAGALALERTADKLRSAQEETTDA